MASSRPSLFATRPRSTRRMAAAITVAVTALAATSTPLVDAATGLLKNAAWTDGSNCVDQPWYTTYAVLYRCHGEKNQQWELTSDGLIRSQENNCFELPEIGDELLVVPCDASRRQKWFVVGNQIKPQGFRLQTGDWSMRLGWCVDATQPDGKLIIHACHGGQNQKFSNPTFPTEPEDVMLVQGPWGVGQNCVDYDFTSDVAYVYACHGQSNQRWSFTAKEELRVMGTKCLEYDDKNGVYVRTCTGVAKQKWVVQSDGHIQPKGYQAADGSFVSMDSKCLDASLDNRKLYLYNCIADQANQKFSSEVLKPKSQDLIKVDGTWADGFNCVDYNYDKGYANIYSCHGLSNQVWELTADNQLRSSMNNMCLTFEDNEVGVYVSSCSASTGLQKWRTTTQGEIHPLGFRKASGDWRTGATRCLTAALDTGILFLYDCTNLVNQKFRSRALTTVRDYLYAGSSCVASDGSRAVVATCASLRAQVWEFTLSSELRVDGKCLAASGTSVSVATCDGSAGQKWKTTPAGAVVPRQDATKCLDVGTKAAPALALSVCGSVPTASQVFRSNVFQSTSGSNSALFDKTSALLDVVQNSTFLTQAVLTAAAEVVAEADKQLATADAAAAKDVLLPFLFGTSAVTDYSVPVKALYQTARSREFLLLSSVLLGAAATKGKTLETIKPFVSVFSDQLYEARYEVLWDRALLEDAGVLEMSVDGTLDDFDELGGMLVAVCRAVPLDLSMCALAQYFQLLDQFVAFRYRLAVEGASGLRNTTLALGAEVVKVFSTSALVANDPLWTRVMSLLLFRASYVDVLPDAVLARASDPSLFLPAFVLYKFFGANNANMAPLETQLRFLSDQITTHHFTKLLKMTDARDMDALDTYMTTWVGQLPLVRPLNNFTSSDFPILVQFVTPLVCDDLARAPLSLCQLETFDEGLQSVLRFERQRRDNVISLDDVLEVDVRKKLDVIDQEKKQYEIISTLQTVANKIGTTINNQMASVKKAIADSTAQITANLEKTRQTLRTAIGELGQGIQNSLDTSTQQLVVQIGESAADIRHDIANNSRQLEQRLDATGQAILGSIEQSKQELKYQIGAEADKTRNFISQKSDELKTHISNEVSGVRQFVDVKTNEIIGVVREEAQTTRVFMDQKTNQVISVVREEGEKSRETVREESKNIQKHLDEKTTEIVGVVKEEGAKTRQVVVEKSAELKTHITNEAEGVKKTVIAAKNEIKSTSTAQYNSLMDQAKQTQKQIKDSTADITKDIHTSTSMLADIEYSSCVKAAVGGSDLKEALGDYSSATSEIIKIAKDMEPDFTDLVKETEKLLEDLWASVYYKASKSIFGCLASLFTLDFGGVVDSVKDGLATMAGADYLKGAQKRVAAAGDELKTTIQKVGGFADKLSGLSKVDPNSWNSLKQVIQGNSEVDDIKAFADDYATYQTTITQANLQDTIHSLAHVIEVSCDGLNEVEESKWPATANGGAKAKQKCGSLTTKVNQLSERFVESLNLLDEIRNLLSNKVADQRSCSKANSAKDWAAGKARRQLRRVLASGVDVPENEPYYSMVYTSLTKLLLDYQLQEAAFQFCKFYEFKNGGVPPPMCGSSSSRTYYTLSQILQMRSWSPPTYRSLGARVYLPTKPAFSDVYNRTYPYVDVGRLLAGGAQYFTLPTWDLDWLKKYGFVSAALTADKVPSIYVESIRIYVPTVTTGDASASTIAATVEVESTTNQYISLSRRDRLYRLPKRKYTFGATYGATSCPDSNFLTNPYDSIAGCVQEDGSSDVCMREKGTTESQTDKQLLPSLFSSWRLSAAFDKPAGSAFDVFVPKKGPSSDVPAVGDFMLVADLSIVQVTTSATTADVHESEISPMAVSQCCAANEFRVAKNKCQACPAGTTGALHGYACVPV